MVRVIEVELTTFTDIDETLYGPQFQTSRLLLGNY